MRRSIGRRPIFFALAALVCVALVPATPSDLRWVTWITAGLGAFWAILLAIDDLATPPPKGEGKVRRESETPFGPPPPPDFHRSQRQ